VKFRDRLLRRLDPNGYNEQYYTGAVQVASTDVNGRDREGSLPNLVRTARQALTDNGIVYACIAMRTGLISEARFKFQRLTDGTLFGDQALAILEHPWPNADSGDLLAKVEQDGGNISGNAYVRLVEPNDQGAPSGLAQLPVGRDVTGEFRPRPPAEQPASSALLVLMSPDTVTIVSEERNDHLGRPYKIPIGYMQDVHAAYGIDADPAFFTVDEVAHFAPQPDPWARWRGMSWLTPAIREVRADQALTTYKVSHLAQGAFPGIIVKSPRKMSDRAIEVLRKRFNTRYGGPDQAGRTIVLDEGLDATVAGHSLEQIQADLVTKAGERRIAAAAHVPLEVLGLEPGDYMAAVRRMADLWARMEWHRICAAVEHLLPPLSAGNSAADTKVPVRLWYDVSGIAALREGELDRAQTSLVKMQSVQAAVMAGYTRDSAVAAADSGDITQLKPDPNAPTPGMAGRVTESEKFGAGTGNGPAPAGPGGGPANGRAPQAGLAQALPGVGKPNLPNALPGSKRVAVPALPGGARGPGGGMKRSEQNGHGDE
jgi:phage portal protein BeeE